jgi:hypothetical protein
MYCLVICVPVLSKNTKILVLLARPQQGFEPGVSRTLYHKCYRCAISLGLQLLRLNSEKRVALHGIQVVAFPCEGSRYKQSDRTFVVMVNARVTDDDHISSPANTKLAVAVSRYEILQSTPLSDTQQERCLQKYKM